VELTARLPTMPGILGGVLGMVKGYQPRVPAGYRWSLPKREGFGSLSLTGELTVGRGQMVEDAAKRGKVWQGKILRRTAG